MPRKSPAAVPFNKFMGKYASDIVEAQAREERRGALPNVAALLASLEKGDSEPPRLITTTMLWDEVEQWWPVRLLRAAAQKNDIEGYKRLLYYFLLRLGVRPPKGVLIPFRWKPGRPEETEMIYAAWVAKGRPPLRWRILEELAKTFYPDQFAKAASDGKLRKNLRDRAGGAIRRRGQRASATKSKPIS